MGLVFRLEVQVGAAILIKDPAGRVADNGVFGFVHLAEDVIQGLQLLGCETRLGKKKWEMEVSKLNLTTLCLALTSLCPCLTHPKPQMQEKNTLKKKTF